MFCLSLFRTLIVLRSIVYLCRLVAPRTLIVGGTVSALAGQAHPYRGGVPWSIVLCRFSDSPTPPHDPAYYRDLIVNRGTGGLSDFIAGVSYGNSDLTPSVVKGWYVEPFTKAQEDALGGGGSPTRVRKYQAASTRPLTTRTIPIRPRLGNWSL